MKRIPALFVMTMLLLLSMSPARAADAAQKFFDTSLGDFRAELDAARSQGKAGVLVMFEADACPYCRRMREQVLSRDEVQAYYRKHFATFAVDVLGDVPVQDFAGKDMREKDLARAYKVRGTPTFLFVGPDGQEMTRFTGATKDAAEFLRLGRHVVDGNWRSGPFARDASR